jgi:hypothetical protein
MASTLTTIESSGLLRVGTYKTLVYAASIYKEEARHRRIAHACQTIHNCPSIFQRMRQPTLRRVEACIESHGGHFEHLL